MGDPTPHLTTYSCIDFAVRSKLCQHSVAERLWSKFERVEGHWLWTGAINSNGYGHVKLDGHTQSAHRVMYELLVGPIPDGLDIDHRCRVRHCVNPAHLEPVTPRENTMRGMSPTAKFASQTHCKRGHPFSEENTYIIPSTGARQCKTCARIAGIRRDEKSRRKRQRNRGIKCN